MSQPTSHMTQCFLRDNRSNDLTEILTEHYKLYYGGSKWAIKSLATGKTVREGMKSTLYIGLRGLARLEEEA